MFPPREGWTVLTQLHNLAPTRCLEVNDEGVKVKGQLTQEAYLCPLAWFFIHSVIHPNYQILIRLCLKSNMQT